MKPAGEQSPYSDVLNLSSIHARNDAQQRGLARAVQDDGRLRVAQDLLIRRDDLLYSIHGVGNQGFLLHSGEFYFMISFGYGLHIWARFLGQ